jgi:GMP synthase (glutamine-hydrolysing)
LILPATPSVARVFYEIKSKGRNAPYIIGLRAVQTTNFLTARVSEIPWTTLDEVAQKILDECADISTVYYDITSKPPGTIEME